MGHDMGHTLDLEPQGGSVSVFLAVSFDLAFLERSEWFGLKNSRSEI